MFVSTQVKDIFCITNIEFDDLNVITENGTINWDWYIEHHKVNHVKQSAVEAFRFWKDTKYSPAETDHILRKLIQLFSLKRYSLVCLSTIPLIERTLFHICGERNGENSALLKQLLERDQSALPKGCQLLLKKLFLPTNGGLNLRNIVWHGFLGQHEIPPEYCALLLSIYITLRSDKLLCTISKSASIIQNSFAEFASIADDMLEQNFDFAGNILIHETRMETFQQVLCDYKTGEYLLCINALVPLIIEHGLRGVYGKVNNCMDVCIAEHGKYFTTLDGYGQRDIHNVMLCLKTANGNRNKLFQLFPGTMELLLDVFLFKKGLVLRSQVAHGFWNFARSRSDNNEVSTNNETQYLFHIVAATLLVIIASFTPNTKNDSTHAIYELVHNWKTKFHPLAIAKAKYVHAWTTWRTLELWLDNRTIEQGLDKYITITKSDGLSYRVEFNLDKFSLLQRNISSLDSIISNCIELLQTKMDCKSFDGDSFEHFLSFDNILAEEDLFSNTEIVVDQMNDVFVCRQRSAGVLTNSAKLVLDQMNEMGDVLVNRQSTAVDSKNNAEVAADQTCSKQSFFKDNGSDQMNEMGDVLVNRLSTAVVPNNIGEITTTFELIHLLCHNILAMLTELECATISRKAKSSKRKSLVRILAVGKVFIKVNKFMLLLMAGSISSVHQYKIKKLFIAFDSFQAGCKSTSSDIISSPKVDILVGLERICEAIQRAMVSH